MPPVAESFKQVVVRLLGKRSLRDLSRQLHDLDNRQSAESWWRSLNRYDKQWPEEETAKLIAKALEVPRTHLPRPPTTSELLLDLSDLLESLGAKVDRMDKALAEGFDRLGGAIALLEERLPPQDRKAQSS